MEKNNIGIGKRIKERRLELGLTQTELAQRLGYNSKVSVCKVESGYDNLTSDRIAKFAQALNCDPGDLMGWGAYDLVDYKEEEIIHSFITLDKASRMRVLQKLMSYEAEQMRGVDNANS